MSSDVAIAARIFFVIVSTILTLTSCTKPKSNTIELQFSFWGSIEQLEVEQSIIAEFEKANPSIKIKTLTSGSRYNTKIQAMMVGDIAPDIIMVEMSKYDEWASRGVLLDVTDIIEKITQNDELLPIPRKAFERNGRFYSIPTNCHALATYYNIPALQKAGISVPESGFSWEELLTIAPKLSRRGGDPNAPTDFVFLMPPPFMICAAYGVQLFDNDQSPTQITINNPTTIQAFELIRRFKKSGYVVPPDVASDQGTYQLFRDGKLAFFFNGRWATPEFIHKTNFEWDVLPPPKGPAGAISQHGGTSISIWSKSQNIEAAKKFLEFYGSSSGQRLAMKGRRTVPVFKSIVESNEFLDMSPPENIQRFSNTMKANASRSLIYAPGFTEAHQIFAHSIDEVIFTEESIETIIARLEWSLKRWLEKQQQRKTFYPHSKNYDSNK